MGGIALLGLFALLHFTGTIDSAEAKLGALGTIQGINLPDSFIMTTMDLNGQTGTGITTAPAINCSLENIVQVEANDGSIHTLTSFSSGWSPTADTLIDPYNKKVVKDILVNVHLYCSPSTLAQYGYYPYLTGGTVGVELSSRDSNGIFSSGKGANFNIAPALINGKDIIIATAVYPASSIPQQSGDYYSQQKVVTTGNLQFKQKLAPSQLTFTHSISGLFTTFDILVSNTSTSPVASYSSSSNQQCMYGMSSSGFCNPKPSCSYPQVPSATGGCVTPPSYAQQDQPRVFANPPTSSISQPYCPDGTFPISQNGVYSCLKYLDYIQTYKQAYDKSKTDTIDFTVAIQGWSYSESNVPVVRITSQENPTYIFEMTLSPKPDTTSGYFGFWHKQISISSVLHGMTGKFDISLLPYLIKSTNYALPSTYNSFIVIDSTPTPSNSQVVQCPSGSTVSVAKSLDMCNPNTSGTNVGLQNNFRNCPLDKVLVPDANGGTCQPIAQGLNAQVAQKLGANPLFDAWNNANAAFNHFFGLT